VLPLLYRFPSWPSNPKDDESQTNHPGSNARPPSAPAKAASDNEESDNGRPIGKRAESADITEQGLCSHLPRDYAKAQKRAPRKGGASQNPKSSGCAPELAYLVGYIEALIVHPRAFHSRARRLSIPTRYSVGS
jgi:hypothetical protein